MSSILIKGLKMPKGDELLCIKIYPSGKVTFDMDLQCKQIAEAFELSDHGYSVSIEDAKKEIDRFIGYLDEDMILRIKLALSKLPVVIPAERSDCEKLQLVALEKEKSAEEVCLVLWQLLFTERSAETVKVDSFAKDTERDEG